MSKDGGFMSSKVSMVIPCYNKADYIADMFQSVYNQKWDDIELIIVNDGSTDGTREKITIWASKFKERGYEINVIDQDNKGVGTAVKNGLMQVTGDYVCLPDCDDTLSPHYVSRMAEVMEKDPAVQWVWCNVADNNPILQIKDGKKLLLFFLCKNAVSWAVYNKLIRVSYLKQSRVLDIFIESKITQEPQVMIPLTASGILPHIVCEDLYIYNASVYNSIRNTSRKSYESVVAFWGDYKRIQIETLDALGLNNAENIDAVEASISRIIRKDLNYIMIRGEKCE